LDSNQICVDANNKRLIVAPKNAQVLEKLVLVADGRSVIGLNKTYVTDSISTTTEVPSKVSNPYSIEIPGSKISYVPPTGTRQVVVEIEFFVEVESTSCAGGALACSHSGQISTWLQLGTNYQNKAFETVRTESNIYTKVKRRYVVHINPTAAADDHTRSILKSWDTPIDISVWVMEGWSENTKLILHRAQNWGSSGNLEDWVNPPTLIITAIGEGY
jgi:hypothetical protein